MDYRQIFVKNTTQSEIIIDDLGLTLPPSLLVKLNWEDINEITDSASLRSYIESGNIIVNNGTSDLPPLEASSYIDPFNNLQANYFTKNQLNDGQLDSRYYIKSQVTSMFGDYYNRTEIDTNLSDYYTKSQIDNVFISYYNKSQSESMFSPLVHNHDSSYYTKTQLQSYGSAQINWNNITNISTGSESQLGIIRIGNGLLSTAGLVYVAFTGSGSNYTVSHSDHTHLNDSSIGGPYYTQSQLQTAGQSVVDWLNISNKPTLGVNNWISSVKAKYIGDSAPSGSIIGGITYLDGDRLIWSSGTGSNQHIYQFNGTNWNDIYTPMANDTVVIAIDSDDSNQSVDLFNGTIWVKIADPSWQSHSNLTNLSSDDHNQYLNLSRHSAITSNPHSTTLTQTILADSLAIGVSVPNLLTLENGSDAGSLHIHDARYFTQTQLSSTISTSGAARIGINTISGLSSTTVQTALVELKNLISSSSCSLNSAYSVGRTITASSGAVVIDTSAATNSPLELTNRSSAPTTGLSAGQICVVDNVLYIYDGSRSKWLSPSKSLIFAKSGGSRGQQLRLPDGLGSYNSGAPVPFDGTITSFAFHTTTTGTTTGQGYIRVNGVTQHTFTVNMYGNASSNSLNINISQDDIISVVMSPWNPDLQNCSCNVEYCWRL